MVCSALIDGSEECGVSMCPSGELVITVKELVAYRVNTAGQRLLVSLIEPGPESGGYIESVVTVLGLDKHVGVDQIHQTTPSSAAMFSKVACFLVPSKR